MISHESQIEANAKKILAVKDFKLLSTPGILGTYKECELTHIYLIETNTKKYIHYFALLSYEEYYEHNKELREIYLTPKLININKNYKLGILQSRISLNDADKIFNQLCVNNLCIDKIIFCISDSITVLPKTHIPSFWENDSSILQKVLKNNFWGDNYIIEFFSNKNPLEKLLTGKDINKLNEEIKKIINIDLDNIYDRIGSFIFQFPITLITANIRPMEDWCNAKYSIKTYQPFDQDNNLISIISTNLDNLLTSYNYFEGICKDRLLELGDSHNFEFFVINKQNNLIYQHFKGNFMRYFNINGHIGIHNSEPRTFINSDNEEIHIDLYNNDFSTGRTTEENYAERINNRIQNNNTIKISGDSMIFNKQRKGALLSIRKLIHEKSDSSSEIWILDPYLLSKDIIDTLYYHSLRGIKLKCITSYKKSRLLVNQQINKKNIILKLIYFIYNIFKKNDNKPSNYFFNKFKKEQKEYFYNHSNNLGIILEYRTTHDSVGFDFHDRFLYFIPNDLEALPIVYSLGTSINSLGNAHHIMQRVPDPRELVNIFQELWNLLDNEADGIIKLPEEK